jgi:GNAT superfamily N-acetyltransferase
MKTTSSKVFAHSNYINGPSAASCSFCPVSAGHEGLLAEMLMDSYRPLFEENPGWEHLPGSFRQFDTEVFRNLETLGRCVFLTCIDGQFAGFSSFDPRQVPSGAIIGHNCVVPRFQSRGLGAAQVLETLRRMKVLGCRRATVTTSTHPFFLPARRMYKSGGFSEADGRAAAPGSGISFERELGSPSRAPLPTHDTIGL